jgi:hypothetical protein
MNRTYQDETMPYRGGNRRGSNRRRMGDGTLVVEAVIGKAMPWAACNSARKNGVSISTDASSLFFLRPLDVGGGSRWLPHGG